MLDQRTGSINSQRIQTQIEETRLSISKFTQIKRRGTEIQKALDFLMEDARTMERAVQQHLSAMEKELTVGGGTSSQEMEES